MSFVKGDSKFESWRPNDLAVSGKALMQERDRTMAPKKVPVAAMESHTKTVAIIKRLIDKPGNTNETFESWRPNDLAVSGKALMQERDQTMAPKKVPVAAMESHIRTVATIKKLSRLRPAS